jgi:release factor H-coupled RctB family protein
LHPGKGSPVGAVFVTEGVIYPHLIGGDIGCGMALFRTDLVRSDAKPDLWAEKYFHLEHPWNEDVSDFLAEHDLESTEFDTALGTIGGGNHFAELQTVEQVLDAGAFKQLGVGKQQLVVLVHSGSRGLGESTLRAHLNQHFGNGVEADSFVAEEYFRGHDFAVRWAKANRELIARRFVATIGAEAECLWDGCHNSITRREGDGGVEWLHRKGAVEAESDFVVIPGSRGSLSCIVKPIGDGESHAWSLAHGAGRKWARSDARQRMRERFGTRIAPRTVCTALSPARTGSVIHSSHVTGRSASARAPSPSSMPSAVATFVAIWQNASAGVRMLIACQLRLSTSTMVLFNMSDIKSVISDR